MKAPRKRGWLRRWTVRLVLAAIVVRVLLAVFLTQIVGLVAGMFGLDVTMRSASLSVTGLSFRAEDLVAKNAERPNDEPLLQAQDLVADLSLSHLLVGDLVVVDAAVSGAVIRLRRDRSGRWSLPSAWLEPAPVTSSPAPPPAGTAPAPAEPPSFALPLSIDSARLQNVQLQFVDEASSPVATFDAELDVDVQRVGRRDQPGTLTLRVHAPAWFDALWLRAEITTLPDRFALTWDSSLRGVRTASLPLSADAQALLAGVHRLGLDVRGNARGHVLAGAENRTELTSVVRVAVQGDERECLAITAAAGPTATIADGDVVPFTCLLTAPDLVQQLRITDGLLTHHADRTHVRSKLSADGATLRRVAPWLATKGVTMPVDGLQLAANLDAELGAATSASLHDVVLRGGDDEVRWRTIAVRDLRATADGIAIDSCEIVGPEVKITTTADGGVQFAGVRLVPVASAVGAPLATAGSGTTGATGPAAPTGLPRLRIGSVRWHGARCELLDQRLTPPQSLVLDQVRVDADALTLGVNAPPGRFAIEARVGGAIEALRAEFTVTPATTSLAIAGQVQANGVTAASLAPWLAAAGIEPRLRAGSLQLLAAVDLATTANGLTIDGRLANVALRDGDDVLLQVRNIDAKGLRLDDGKLDLGNWQVKEPFVALHRGNDGSTTMFGLCFGQPLNGAPAVSPTPRPTPAVATPAEVATTTPKTQHLVHGSVVVESAVVAIHGSDAQAPLRIGVDANLQPTLPDAPTPFELGVRVEGSGDARVHGSIDRRDGLALDVQVAAKGLRGVGLARALPPAVLCTLTDGALRAHVGLELGAPPENRIELRVTDLVVEDRGAELLALQALVLHCPSCTGERIHIAELTGSGLRGLVTTTADGLHVPGFCFATVVAAQVAEATAPATATAPSPAVAAAPLRLPLLTVDKLSLACERFVIRDRTAGDGEPLVVSGTLTMEPWSAAIDTDDGDGPPAHLVLTVAAPPLCRELRADVLVQPFALVPSCEVTLAGDGIDPAALPTVFGTLRDQLGGSGAPLTFTAKGNARLDLRRRDGQLFDFGNPFGGEFGLEHVELREAAGDRRWLAIGAIDVAARSIDPRSGDVLLRMCVINDVRLDVTNHADGYELLGMRFQAAPAPAVPTGAGNAPPAPPPAHATATDAPVFAVDRLSLHGLVLNVDDRTTSPPTLLPITDGDLELTRFSTDTSASDRSFGFQMSLRGGEVPLPRRELHSSFFTGVLGKATNVLGKATSVLGGGDAPATEPRLVFEEITVSGRLQPAPVLRGEIYSTVTALELQALRGLVKDSGVEIGDGVFDQSLRAEIDETNGIAITSNHVFTWLSLSEPADGPITSWLGVSAPLDSVLFLLRNEADELRLPVRIKMPAAGFSANALSDLVAETIARLIAEAATNAPERALGAVTGAFDFGLFGSGPSEAVTIAMPFAAGDPLPASFELAPIVAAMTADASLDVVLGHELGTGDLERAAALATPPPAVLADEVARLRQRRDELTAARTTLARDVAAMWAAGQQHEVRPRQAELADLDDRLGALERALDRASMLSDDSPRQKQRRTRLAAQALGAARLAAVRAELLRLVPAGADRLVVRPARGIPVADRPDGGQVIATTRKRTSR